MDCDSLRDKTGNRIKGWVKLVNPAPLVILSMAESVQRHISPIPAEAVRTASEIANSGIRRQARQSGDGRIASRVRPQKPRKDIPTAFDQWMTTSDRTRCREAF